MKINNKLYETIKSGFRTVIDYYGGPARCRERFAGKSDKFIMWAVWWTFAMHKTCSDTHPAIKKFGRILPYEPGWDIYAIDDSINDDHIETAIMKAGRELGMINL